ncbi:MAG: hypothetical protein ACYDAG_05030 [Chloroflexota bacterium]
MTKGGGWTSLLMRLSLSLLCLAATGVLLRHTTTAALNATTQNGGTTLTAGTVLMSNAGSQPCSSVNGGNCGSVVMSSNTAMAPGSIASGTIAVTNTGTLPALMSLTVSLNSTYTTSGFNAYLNLTIHDDTSGYCIYGTVSPPTNGPCDNLTLLTSQQPNDAFPGASAIGPLALPALAGPNQPWAAPEAHTLTVTVEVVDSTIPSTATGSLDLSWTGVSLP